LKCVRLPILLLAAWACLSSMLGDAWGESGAEAWLRYAPLNPQTGKLYRNVPAKIVLRGDSLVLRTAGQELARGIEQMLGRSFGTGSVAQDAFLLGTLPDLRTLEPEVKPPQALKPDGFWLKAIRLQGTPCVIITAANDRGVLYGVFALLGKVARGESIGALDE